MNSIPIDSSKTSIFLQENREKDGYIKFDLELVIKSSNLLFDKQTVFITNSNSQNFIKYQKN